MSQLTDTLNTDLERIPFRVVERHVGKPGGSNVHETSDSIYLLDVGVVNELVSSAFVRSGQGGIRTEWLGVAEKHQTQYSVYSGSFSNRISLSITAELSRSIWIEWCSALSKQEIGQKAVVTKLRTNTISTLLTVLPSRC